MVVAGRLPAGLCANPPPEEGCVLCNTAPPNYTLDILPIRRKYATHGRQSPFARLPLRQDVQPGGQGHRTRTVPRVLGHGRPRPAGGDLDPVRPARRFVGTGRGENSRLSPGGGGIGAHWVLGGLAPERRLPGTRALRLAPGH